MSLLSISQPGYPKLKIIDGDTVVLLTLQQTRKVNETHVNLYECRELLDNMTDQVLIYDSLASAHRAVAMSQALEIDILENMNADRAGIIERVQEDLKRARRKIKVQKLLKWGGFLSGIAAGFFVPRALNL